MVLYTPLNPKKHHLQCGSTHNYLHGNLNIDAQESNWIQLFWIQHESSVRNVSVEAVRREYHRQADVICSGKLFNQGHHFTVTCNTLANVRFVIKGSSSGIFHQFNKNTLLVAKFKKKCQ